MNDVHPAAAIAPILIGLGFLTAGVMTLASLLGYTMVATVIFKLAAFCLSVGGILFGAAFLVVWGYELAKG